MLIWLALYILSMCGSWWNKGEKRKNNRFF